DRYRRDRTTPRRGWTRVVRPLAGGADRRQGRGRRAQPAAALWQRLPDRLSRERADRRRGIRHRLSGGGARRSAARREALCARRRRSRRSRPQDLPCRPPGRALRRAADAREYGAEGDRRGAARHRSRRKSGAAWIQDIDLLARVSPEAADLAIAGIRPRFEDAFGRVSSGEMENDGLNRLVLAAGLSWHQVVILRLYAKVLRQAGSTFSQAYMEDALAAHPAIAGLLVALFERQFNPAAQARNGGTGDVADVEGIVAAIEQRLDDVANLDEDRILRSFLLLVRKSLRTNYYQRTPAGQAKPYLSVKLASLEIDLLPAPRPLVE